MSDNLNTIGIRGKIAARTPDYRYTLPEGGNPGDIPVDRNRRRMAAARTGDHDP